MNYNHSKRTSLDRSVNPLMPTVTARSSPKTLMKSCRLLLVRAGYGYTNNKFLLTLVIKKDDDDHGDGDDTDNADEI